MEDLQLQSTPTSAPEETTVVPLEGARYGMALDPGETAGLVIAIYDHQKFEVQQAYTIRHDDECMESLEGVIGMLLPKPVICESFRLYAHKAKAQIRSTFPTIEMIGMLKAVCWWHALDAPIMQSPTCKGEVAIMHDGVGDSPHVKDAYRHFRYWWLTEYRR